MKLERALQYKAPYSDFTQGLTCVWEAGGREGRVRVTCRSRTWPWRWRVLLEARQGQPLHLRPPVESAFPFTQHLFSAPGCPPRGGGRGHPWGRFLFPSLCRPLPSWTRYDCFSGHSAKMPVENGSISCLSNFFF